jgi:uncharacterized cupredoxin-like copper-binding protein
MRVLRNPRLLLAATLGVVAIGVLAALAPASPEADDGVYEVRLLDGAIEPESRALAAGERVIEVTNAGSVEHELVLLRTPRPADRLPYGLHGVSIGLSGEPVIGEDHSALGHDHAADDVLGLLSGESARYRVELRAGHYVLFCQSGNHYLSGEHAELTVR